MIPNMAFEWFIDLEEIKRIDRSGSAKRVKREWIKKGYDQQMSLYGVLTNREEGESGYCRIEILANIPYSEKVVFLIYQFFLDFKPPRPYTIWIFNKDREALRQVGRYA